MRHNVITEGLLDRIESNARRAGAAPREWGIKRLRYNHGALSVVNHEGKEFLAVVPNGEVVLGNLSTMVHDLTPSNLQELVRGYRLAKDKGLL